MATWTDDAKEYLDGYLRQAAALLRAGGSDAEEVVGDLRRHIEQLADSSGSSLVTIDVARRILTTVGTPEEVATSWSQPGVKSDEPGPWDAAYLNPPAPTAQPWRNWVWALLAGAVIIVLGIVTMTLAKQGEGDDRSIAPTAPPRSVTQVPHRPAEPQPPATEPATVSHRDGPLPGGWFQAGSNHVHYQTGTASGVGGMPEETIFIRSTDPAPSGFSTVMANAPGGPYRGKQVTLKGTLKTQDVKGWVGMWLRIDGPQNAQLGFDNMHDRPIIGTTQASQHAIVLDVPDEAVSIAYGVLLAGAGQVWFGDMTLSAE